MDNFKYDYNRNVVYKEEGGKKFCIVSVIGQNRSKHYNDWLKKLGIVFCGILNGSDILVPREIRPFDDDLFSLSYMTIYFDFPPTPVGIFWSHAAYEHKYVNAEDFMVKLNSVDISETFKKIGNMVE